MTNNDHNLSSQLLSFTIIEEFNTIRQGFIWRGEQGSSVLQEHPFDSLRMWGLLPPVRIRHSWSVDNSPFVYSAFQDRTLSQSTDIYYYPGHCTQCMHMLHSLGSIPARRHISKRTLASYRVPIEHLGGEW